VFDEMDNKSISVSGSGCLISYVNVVPVCMDPPCSVYPSQS
jgi:hypothetical protein